MKLIPIQYERYSIFCEKYLIQRTRLFCGAKADKQTILFCLLLLFFAKGIDREKNVINSAIRGSAEKDAACTGPDLRGLRKISITHRHTPLRARMFDEYRFVRYTPRQGYNHARARAMHRLKKM